MLSVVSHRPWITNGRLKEWPINDYRIQCKMNNKNAIKAARRVKTNVGRRIKYFSVLKLIEKELMFVLPSLELQKFYVSINLK